MTDAFPWNEAPHHLIRDRDGAFGPAYTHRIRAMGIRDHPTAPRSPWQNGQVERLIGSIRRESLDHLVVFDEAQLRRVLKNYAFYYNQVRTPLTAEECAGFSAPGEDRPYRSNTNSRRASSSIRPGLGFDQAQGPIANRSTESCDECLNGESFYSLKGAQIVIELAGPLQYDQTSFLARLSAAGASRGGES